MTACAGRILREPIAADRAYPPMDKICMDGIAIRFGDYSAGTREFRVIGIGKAGEEPIRSAGDGTCSEVMTGAPCPSGYDCVIPIEQVVYLGDFANVLPERSVRPGQNVHRMGSDCAAGRFLLSEGQRLNAARIAIAASVGMTSLKVTRRPVIRVIATGDEIVGPGKGPMPWQLRQSNAPALAAMMSGFASVETQWVRDDPDALRESIGWGLEGTDLFVLSGGVSAGKFDFVPAALESAGITRSFHKAAIRPGKPLWFGLTSDGRPVFGLPGNPVSFLICLRRFVLPLLHGMSGAAAPLRASRIRLGSEVNALPGQTHFLPVQCMRANDGGSIAVPCPTNGSGDFCGLGNSDGFVEIEPAPLTGSRPHRSPIVAGDSVPWFPWEG